MENQARTSNQETAIKVVSGIFGTIHLALDILATGTAMAEANIIKKIDPHTPETVEELVNHRRVLSQAKRTEMYNRIKAKTDEVKAKMEANETKLRTA